MLRRLAMLLPLMLLLPRLGLAADVSALRVGHTGDYAPFEFVDAAGTAKGYLIDCYKLWSKKTGQPVELIHLPWNECLRQLEAGTIDVVTGMTPTAERGKLFQFSQPICKAESRIFTHNSLPPPTGLHELAGLVVGAVSEDRSAKHIASAVPEAVLKAYSGYGELARAAARGEIKVLVGTSAVIHHMLTIEGAQGYFTTSAFTLNEDPLAAAVAIGRNDLLKLLNDGFSAFDDRDWENLARRWVPYTLKPGLDGVVLTMILWGGGIMVLALVILMGTLVWNRQLQRRVNALVRQQEELTRSLNQTQRLDALGRMASGVAHDFNNILQAIMAHAEVLEDFVPEKGRGSTVAIANAAERASGLSRQLLMFARAEPLPIRHCDLNEIVTSTWQLLGSTLGTGIDRKMSLAQEAATVMADPDRLHSMLINLAVNARDALEDHGTITVRTQITTMAKIPLEAREALGDNKGHVVLLSFSDNGPGIAKEIQDRVFEPFFTTKPPHHGTGLGLAAVYGTVKDSMGHIGLECGPNGGTTFNIYFPHADDPRNATANEEDGAQTQTGLTLVVVDDSPALRETTTANLRMDGHRVLSAASGGEALHLMGVESEVDIAIIDHHMPGMDGLTLSRHLRNLNPEIPLILATGDSDEINDSHGFDGVIRKPFRRDELNKVIADVLAHL